MTLVRGAVRADTTSMQGLVKFCYGYWGTVFLNLSLLSLAWGFLATYTVIIGDELPAVLHSKKLKVVGDPFSYTQFFSFSPSSLPIFSSCWGAANRLYEVVLDKESPGHLDFRLYPSTSLHVTILGWSSQVLWYCFGWYRLHHWLCGGCGAICSG